jgi:hypothetical protein
MTDAPTPLDLDELDRLEKKASFGPWRIDYNPDYSPNLWVGNDDVSSLMKWEPWTGDPENHEEIQQQDFDDAAFVAALRNAAPGLIAAARERDELRAERDKLRETLEQRVE